MLYWKKIQSAILGGKLRHCMKKIMHMFNAHLEKTRAPYWKKILNSSSEKKHFMSLQDIIEASQCRIGKNVLKNLL